MKKVINIMVIVIAAAFGIFMFGAKFCSTTTVTMTSNIEPKNRVDVETTTWENVEVEDWD